MELTFQEQSWEIIDDFSNYQGWVGLSWGDIYQENTALGYYVAAWYIDKIVPVKMLITCVDEKLEEKCQIGVEVMYENKLNIKPLSEEQLPWDNYDVIHPKNYSSFSRATEALNMVESIIKGDKPLTKYLLNPSIILSSKGQMK